MRAKLATIKQELRRRLHAAIPEQGAWLRRVVSGYFAYHAAPTNSAALSSFRYRVSQLWLRSLRQRSQRSAVTWHLMAKLEAQWLPKPRILHPWPSKRFAVNHPRWEPYALIGHVRI
jgi:RNA-directed DNA polymerase